MAIIYTTIGDVRTKETRHELIIKINKAVDDGKNGISIQEECFEKNPKYKSGNNRAKFIKVYYTIWTNLNAIVFIRDELYSKGQF